MKKETIEKILTENVKFYPPKTVIEFIIDDGLETTGSIEEYNCNGNIDYTLYIDGDEQGYFDTIEDAKIEIAEWINESKR